VAIRSRPDTAAQDDFAYRALSSRGRETLRHLHARGSLLTSPIARGQAAEKFESKPGSGVTLWVLEQEGPIQPNGVDASRADDVFSRRQRAQAAVSAPPVGAPGQVQGLKPSKSVFMGGWQVTDRNMENFQGLAELESLNLSNANVTTPD